MLTTLITLKDLQDLGTFKQFLFWDRFQWRVAMPHCPGPDRITYYMSGTTQMGELSMLPKKLYLLTDGDTLQWNEKSDYDADSPE